VNDTPQESERGIAAALVERVRDGDGQAEIEIVNRYQRGLRFLLRRRVRNPELADELAQETWILVFRKLRDGVLEDPGKLSAYICGVARNLAIGELRKQHRRKTAPDTDFVAGMADGGPSPYEQLSRAEVCQHVRSIIGEMRVARDREVLLRFYVRDEDKERICEDLGIDSVHFNRVLFRARQRFKDAILRAGRARNL
jgi:RNA polymerase sigma-70 factor (ECF subfamily)